MQNRIAVNPADPVLIRNFQGEVFSGLFPENHLSFVRSISS